MNISLQWALMYVLLISDIGFSINIVTIISD
ncbi:putative membrane protein, partial [Vibrio harveyi]